MDFELANQKLTRIHQEHLLQHWKQLTSSQQTFLLRQINALSPSIFKLQQDLVLSTASKPDLPLDPFLDYAKSGSPDNIKLGKELIAGGKVGCLLVAGGQGTRLRFEGPKGMFPISHVRHKTLFQLFAEKVVAASKQAGRKLPLAIMTSPLNDAETQNFFSVNQNFGLQEGQLSFFTQKMLPLLDPKGNLFLESRNTIAEAPNGNGGALQEFYESGIWKRWKESGIEYVNFILIDNPLADPFDADLIGYHALQNADITFKCTKREHEKEKVGVIVKQEGKIKIREYSELSSAEQQARLPNGQLKHSCASLSLFCFSLPFIQKAAQSESQWPLHKAFKAAKYLDKDGQTLMSPKPTAWKFEYFIFDAIFFTDRIRVLLFPREECFSPLKNDEGESSPTTVQASLQEADRLTYQKITGTIPPRRAFELSQDFYYPTPELLKKWKGRPLPPEPYIEESI